MAHRISGRFTDPALRAIDLAEDEARMFNHDHIGTEHMLLGLIGEGQGDAAAVLESLGITLDAVRRQVEEIISPGQQAPSGHIPFTPRAKKVIELSLREALGRFPQSGRDYIGTDHILAGLLREGDGIAAQVLVNLGANLDRVRQQAGQLRSSRTQDVAEIGQFSARPDETRRETEHMNHREEEAGKWSRQYKANLDKLASRNLAKTTEVVRDLELRDRQRGLSGAEQRMLARARHLRQQLSNE